MFGKEKYDLHDWKWKTYKILEWYTPIQIQEMIEDLIILKADSQYGPKLQTEGNEISLLKNLPFKEAQDYAKVYGKKQEKIYVTGNLKEINSSLKISDVAKKYGLKVKGNKVICPFHNDKDPSLSLDDKKNVFYCFGCKAKGNIIEFIKRMRRLK